MDLRSVLFSVWNFGVSSEEAPEGVVGKMAQACENRIFAKKIKTMIRKISLLTVFLSLLFGTSLFCRAQQESGVQTGFEPGAYYVKFVSGSVGYAKASGRTCPVGILFPQKGNILEAYGLHQTAYSMHQENVPFLENVFRIDFDSVAKADAFLRQLCKDSRIEFVEPVPEYRIFLEQPEREERKNPTDDPFFGSVDGVNTSWHLEMLGFSEVHGKYPVDTNLVVAVVDNAVWGEHEDLQIGSSLMYDVSSGQLGTSRPPKWIGQNQMGTPEAPSSAYKWSHGTHCAGLVGAVTGNGKGIASLAGGVRLMGVKIAQNDPMELAKAVQGVIWAAEHGARVISMSFGGTSRSSVEQATYEGLAQKGIVMVAAAGNSGMNQPNYPAAYPGVISVGSVNSDGSKSYFSNYGNWVDVWAPGGFWVENGNTVDNVQIFSTTYCVSQYYSDKENLGGKYYDAMTGTSMATPLVSSAASLLLSSYPGMNPYEMHEVLVGSMQDNFINLPAAFRYVEEAPQVQVRNLEAWWNPSSKNCEIRWQQPEKEGVTGYAVYRNGQRVGTTQQTSFSFQMQDTVGFLGVRSVFRQDSTLTKYVKVQIGDFPSVGNGETAVHEPLQIRVDTRTGILTIEGEAEFERVEIYNIQGVRLRSFSVREPVYRLGNLPRGLYIGRAVSQGVSRTFKFVL